MDDYSNNKDRKGMKGLSFFFLEKGAGLIDGRQIGEFLGAKLNPTDGFEDDICIYVKCQPPENFPKYSYINIVDGVGLIPWIKSHPQIGVIVTSITAKKYLSEILNKSDVKFIPEHHCNYERFKRSKKEINTVGVIGNQKGFDYDIQETSKQFREIGFEFKYCGNYKNRFDVINFYQTIDIQINWRPHVTGAHAKLHNPLKLANAASFGIPTVSYTEENYVEEFGGYFVEAEEIDEIFLRTKMLQDFPLIYETYSDLLLKKSEEYHIENVANLYRGLTEV